LRNNNKTTTVLRPFARDYPSEPVPEETFTHLHLSWSSIILYQPHPSTTILFYLRAWQSFCITSLQVLSSPPFDLKPFTSYSINSSPNHCFLFTAHAHAIATYFSVVRRLCYLILVSL